MQDIKVEDFEKVCENISLLRAEIAAKKADVAKVQEYLDKEEKKAMTMLEASEKTKYVSEHGTIYTAVYDSISVPKGDSKQEFFSYLKDVGIYDEVVTVNSQWLNGWYRKEKEAAIENGDILFTIPGINNPVSSVRLSFRKV
jgi:hypothetical protein